MTPPKIALEILRETVAAAKEYGSIAEAADALGGNRSTFDARYRRALIALKDEKADNAVDEKDLELPVFPDDDIPVEQILDTMEKRYQKRQTANRARKWFEIKINTASPVCINFVGDPHVDSNGCNIPLLRRDVGLMASANNFCVNLGDTTDGDWPGRLMKLHAQSDQSITTARRLADWFLNQSGLKFLAILIGNHDAWGEGAEILRRMNIKQIPMLDWTARFKVRFSNDRELKIIASHDFPGHSWINPLHSNQRREMVEEADIYASGHKHQWGIVQGENGYRETCYSLIRARGYKYLDQHAETIGVGIQQLGATISAIIDPTARNEAQFVQCFPDVGEASEFLKWKVAKNEH